MSENINFLIRTDEESLRRKKRVKILNFVALALLICVGLASLIILISIKAINVSSVKKDQEDVLGKISQFQSRQVKLFVLNDRVENIGKILKERKNLSEIMSGLLAEIPNNFSVDDFEINDKSVIISGRSKSLFTIGELINNLTDMVREKEIIKSLTLISLSLDSSKNTYQVSVKSEL